MSGVGSSPALATCETSKVLLAGVSGGFPGVLPFPLTYRLARLYNLERDIKLNPKKSSCLYRTALFSAPAPISAPKFINEIYVHKRNLNF